MAEDERKAKSEVRKAKRKQVESINEQYEQIKAAMNAAKN